MTHRFLPALAERSVPRYTSYPTAAEFHAGVGAREQGEALAAIAPKTPVSLYLHIPFCHEICWYCGCNTGAVGRADRVTAYRDALLREIETVGARMRGSVVSVHFGGGSPNALAPDDLVVIAAALRSNFAIASDSEWAAELDPRTLDADYAAALATAGIGRASLGAQTFAPHVQRRINRVQPFRDVARSAEQLRAAGIARVNLDLMYGLPGQTLDDVAATIDQALALTPDRIAVFGYAHMPRMLPRQRMIDESLLPDARARFWQSALAHDLLVEAGFQAIGFDHFAQPDDSIAIAARQGSLRRNFQGFTDDPAATVIGLGASAISQYDGLLVQNEKHVGRYRMLAGNGMLSGVRGVARTADDRLRTEVIERLLCDGTVDAAAIAERHGQSPQVFGDALPTLDALAQEGLVTRDGWRIAILPQGRPYARLAACAFDSYRVAAHQRFSRAV
ncbi:oxygen-independent coproporphyrinogen III oxidase [Sphingomonas sp. CJ20]